MRTLQENASDDDDDDAAPGYRFIDTRHQLMMIIGNGENDNSGGAAVSVMVAVPLDSSEISCCEHDTRDVYCKFSKSATCCKAPANGSTVVRATPV
jgi:hypothetical protein